MVRNGGTCVGGETVARSCSRVPGRGVASRGGRGSTAAAPSRPSPRKEPRERPRWAEPRLQATPGVS